MGEKNIQNNTNITSDRVIAENFTGVGGYMLENQVFDYSDRFETVYEWTENVLLPIEKIPNSDVCIELPDKGKEPYPHLIVSNLGKSQASKKRML